MAIAYHPDVVRKSAAQLYLTAGISQVAGIFLGLGIGAFCWYSPELFPFLKLTQWQIPYVPDASLLLLGLLLALLTMLVGRSVADHQRTQAQLLLCQVEIEQHLADLLKQKVPVTA